MYSKLLSGDGTRTCIRAWPLAFDAGDAMEEGLERSAADSEVANVEPHAEDG